MKVTFTISDLELKTLQELQSRQMHIVNIAGDIKLKELAYRFAEEQLKTYIQGVEKDLTIFYNALRDKYGDGTVTQDGVFTPAT